MNTRAAARTKFSPSIDASTHMRTQKYSHHQDRKKLAKEDKKKQKQKVKDEEERKKRLSERKDGGVLIKSVHVNQLMQPRTGDTAIKQTTSQETPIEMAYSAAKSGNITKLDRVITSEASSSADFLAIHGARIGAIAAEHGKTDILLHLFSMKVNMETKDGLGRTFLYLAVQYAQGETAAELASRGADIHARANNGKSCWELATEISSHLAQGLKLARGNFLKRKREDIIQAEMPYKEGGEEQGGAGAQVAGGGRVTDAQAAFEREYGTKARQTRIMKAQEDITDYVRWGDAFVPIKDQEEEIPDDFNEEDVDLLIRPTQTPQQQEMTAEVSEVIEEIPQSENEEISFYVHLRKSRCLKSKTKPASEVARVSAATGVHDAHSGPLGPLGAPAPTIGSDVEGEGLVRKSLNDVCRVVAQHVLSASKQTLLCTDVHQSLSRFYNTLSVMFTLINEQRGPFILYDQYRQAHGKGGEMQGVLNTQFQMFDAIRAQTGQDNIQGNYLMDFQYHTQSLITLIWDFFRQIEEQSPPEEFKLQIREIAQLTRSVNGIWAETGGRIDEDNPILSLLVTEGVFFSHMLFQAFISCSEFSQKEQLATLNWQMITSMMELTDPVICVSYREPSRTVAQSLSALSSLIPTLTLSSVQAPFGEYSLPSQQTLYETVIQAFVEQFDRFKGDLPDSLRMSLQQLYSPLLSFRKFVAEQLKPVQMQNKTTGTPLIWSLYQFGEAIQKTSYGLFSFLHSFPITKHTQNLLSMCVQASHLYSSTFRVLSAATGSGLSMSGQHHGVICLTVCFYLSTLLPSLRSMALALRALQRQREMEREREEREEGGGNNGDIIQEIEKLSVQEQGGEGGKNKRLTEQTSLYGGPMAVNRMSQYGGASSQRVAQGGCSPQPQMPSQYNPSQQQQPQRVSQGSSSSQMMPQGLSPQQQQRQQQMSQYNSQQMSQGEGYY